jgi:hypothetical protein
MKTKCFIASCILTLLSFCPMAFGLDISSPAILVPGWEPNPNSDQEMSYINPNADFMLVSIHHWPNRYVAKRIWNPATNLWGPAENIGLTGADNTHGYLSPDMDMIMYGAGFWDTMIHRSKWSGSSWLPGEQIFFVPSWCPMFTGSKLYFNICAPVWGNGDDLAVSDYNSVTNQFSPYTPISELNTEYYEDAPWVSSDGKLILFESDRPGGYGGTDIWFASWDASSQKWTNITNLGPSVNTSDYERFPRIAEEAHLLFFTRGLSWNEPTLMQAPIVPEPDPIQEILVFIEKSVADGTLVPVKPGKSGEGQLGALINMIEAAGNLIDANDPNSLADICGQLHAALGKTDGQAQPPDFVTGQATAELAQKIEDLMISLGCK